MAKPAAGTATLNTGHGLYGNIIAAYLLNEGTGTDFVDTHGGTYTATLGASATWITSPIVGVSNDAATGGIARRVGNLGTGYSSFTIVIGFVHDVDADATTDIFNVNDEIIVRTGASLYCGVTYYDGAWRSVASPNAYSLDTRVIFTATVTAGDQYVYYEKTQQNHAHNLGTPSQSAGNVGFGADSAGTANRLDGAIEFVYLFNKVLDQTEREALVDDPWSLYTISGGATGPSAYTVLSMGD